MGELNVIKQRLVRLKLDDSLLFLNYALDVSRDETDGGEVSRRGRTAPLVLPYIIHFLAKQLLLNASNLGTRTLDWEEFEELSNLCIDLDDPISSDPGWKHANPDEFFARTLAQQIPAQERNLIQKYGIALGLFRDVGIVEMREPFDLRQQVESELGLSVDTFMAMGHLAFALRHARLRGRLCQGTFTPLDLARAFEQGLEFCVPEVWTKFLDRVACTRDQFRQIASRSVYRANSEQYDPFSFNPLQLHPIIKMEGNRYLAVDPDLVIDRVTFGLFYDVFAKQKTNFTEKFGFAFEKYVGQLIATVIAKRERTLPGVALFGQGLDLEGRFR